MRVKEAIPNIREAVARTRPAVSNVKEAVPMVLPPIPQALGNGSSEVFTIVRYFGGKHYQIPQTMKYINLVAKANQAHTYIECFAGGARCLLNLNMCQHKFDKAIYNELSSDMAALFMVLKNPGATEKMEALLKQLGVGKELFKYCRAEGKKDDNTLLDHAIMAFILCNTSYNSTKKSIRKMTSTELSNYRNKVKQLKEANRRMVRLNVEVVNGDYRDILAQYGQDPTVLKYCDPPYYPLTRLDNDGNFKKVYENDMTVEQHQEMVKLLCGCQGWVLSGYDPALYGSDDYKPLEQAGAVKVNIGKFNRPSSNEPDNAKDEFIWYKF